MLDCSLVQSAHQWVDQLAVESDQSSVHQSVNSLGSLSADSLVLESAVWVVESAVALARSSDRLVTASDSKLVVLLADSLERWSDP